MIFFPSSLTKRGEGIQKIVEKSQLSQTICICGWLLTCLSEMQNYFWVYFFSFKKMYLLRIEFKVFSSYFRAYFFSFKNFLQLRRMFLLFKKFPLLLSVFLVSRTCAATSECIFLSLINVQLVLSIFLALCFRNAQLLLSLFFIFKKYALRLSIFVFFNKFCQYFWVYFLSWRNLSLFLSVYIDSKQCIAASEYIPFFWEIYR